MTDDDYAPLSPAPAATLGRGVLLVLAGFCSSLAAWLRVAADGEG